MNAWFFGIFDDSLLVWGVNVLVQWSLVTAASLALGALFRRQPAARYGVLFAGLSLVLFVPLLAATVQRAGAGLLSVRPFDAATRTSTTADRMTYSRPEPERDPQTVTDANTGESHRESHRESLTVASAHDEPIAGSPNELAPSNATTVGVARVVMSIVMGIWLAGSVLLVCRMAIGWRRMASILRSSRPTTDEALSAAFAEVSSRMRGATLVISDRVTGPLAAGLRRPCVVFPASLIGRVSAEQMRAILAHELAHLSRRDPAVVLLQNAAGAFGWLHPLVVLLNRQLAQAREEVCDNHVLGDIDAPCYSRTLLTLTQRLQTARPLPGTVGMLTSQWTLESRIAGLLDEARSRATCLTVRGRIAIGTFAVILAGITALGTIGRAAEQPIEAHAAVNALVDDPGKTKEVIHVKGRIETANGEPVGGAFVAVIGTNTSRDYKLQTLAEGVADAVGRYELTISGVTMRSHRDVRVIARADKMALAWQRIDLNLAESRIDLMLIPERLTLVRLVDAQGKPATNVEVELTGLSPTKSKGDDLTGLSVWHIKPQLKNALPRPTCDAGLLTVPGIPPDFGVCLELIPSERFARQFLILNSGQPEERPANDGTYRGIVKNLMPGQIATIPLAPATIFEGVVLLGDTDRPAANARIRISAGDMKGGSMCGFEGTTDARGRFRLNPYAGVRFDIEAYPPTGAPYFPRRIEDLQRKPAGESKSLEIRLPAAMLASGTVIDAESGAPLVGASVQYYAQTENNKNASDDIVTGWQNMERTDDQGRYKITVPPGPGTLLVHAAAAASYVLQEKSEREIDAGKPGGRRHYAHAFQSIAPLAPNEKGKPSDFAVNPIKLQPGSAVVVKLVDGDGKTIEQNIAISKLKVIPHSPFFRGYGRVESGSSVEFRGLEKEKQYTVHFLDPIRRLGATATISAKDPYPTVTLKPCASAKVRILQPNAQPVPVGSQMSMFIVVTPGESNFGPDNHANPSADEDFVDNFDRTNYAEKLATDKNGVLSLPALISGATYRIYDELNRKAVVAKEFVAEAGKLHDLGDIKLHSKR
jgi:beta-lactamase regulating signal transducer with metallopeptidase domain